MAVVVPNKGRATISDGPDGLEISIPARGNRFLLLFLAVWVVGWAFGWVSAFSQLVGDAADRPADWFLVVWLVAWTAGGAFAIGLLAWSLAGREVVTLRPHELAISRRVLGLGRVRQYDLAHVSNLRVSTQAFSPFDFNAGLRFWGVGGGPIAFDYGASTVRFGAAVEEGEASQLVQRLAGRQPSLARAPSA